MRTLLLFLWCALASGQKTDLATYAIPAPPTLPAAGGTFTDSAFSTLLMRVTDATTCPTAAWHDYSYWDVFNKDSTRLQLECTTARYWYDFDPSTDPPTLGTRHTFPLDPHGDAVTGDGRTIWDPTATNKMFVIGPFQKTIWSLNLDTDVYSDGIGGAPNSAVKVFSAGELPAASTYFNTVTVSLDGDVFAGVTDTGCIAWKRSTNTVLHTYTGSEANECQIEKLGNYMVRKPNTGSIYPPVTYLPTNTTTSETQCVAGVPSNWGIYHSDFGRGFAVAMNGLYDDCGGSNLARLYHNLSALTTYRQITPSGNGSDGHVSVRNDDDETATFEYSYCGGGGEGPGGQFQQEIFSTYVDGSFRTLRYAHHHSVLDAGCSTPYRSQPKAVISRDGRFITFDSNWGNVSGRTDVFVVVSARRSATPASSGVTGF